jgi:hypothetical protein
MLNELSQVATALDCSGIKPADWHPSYTPLKKPRLAFFVFLDNHGRVKDIARVKDAEEIAGLRKYENMGGLRESFPYFNMPPLYCIAYVPREEDKEFAKAMEKGRLTDDQIDAFVREKLKNTVDLWNNAADKLEKSVALGQELMRKIDAPPNEARALVELVNRVHGLDIQGFRDGLKRALRSKFHGPDAKLYFDALFGHGTMNNKNPVTWLLELSDASIFPYPVRHRIIRDFINAGLTRADQLVARTGGPIDIFGQDATGWDKKFPDVRNSLGIVKLRTMDKAAACQARYGWIDAPGCPIGDESRRALKAALEWVSTPERENVTWASLRKETRRNQILLVFPSDLPAEPPALTGFFAAPPAEGNGATRFEDCAKRVLPALRGLVEESTDCVIHTFVLRKADTARTQVSSLGQYGAKQMIAAAEEWQKACQNAPPFRIKEFPGQGKRKPGKSDAETPFPMDVPGIACTASHGKGVGVAASAADGIDLLLAQGALRAEIASRLLERIVRNATAAVICIGQANAEGKAPKLLKAYPAHKMPSSIGLLLYKLDITKEIYMDSAPYLMGRMLALSDGLHNHYCRYVRDNDTPPQFIGNSLMRLALDTPEKAFVLYGQRILPYQAWAETTRDKAAMGLAHYFLREIGNVCGAIKHVPERLSDAERATMLLGYLARPESARKELSELSAEPKLEPQGD